MTTRSNIYIMDLGINGLYKIGISKKPKIRLKTLQAGNPKMRLIFYIWIKSPRSTERYLHKCFESKKFDRELFYLSHEDIENTKKYLTRIKNLTRRKIKAAGLALDSGNKSDIQIKPEPNCPECGNSMKLRRPMPQHRWDTFWGCSSYPKCKGKLNILLNGKPDI